MESWWGLAEIGLHSLSHVSLSIRVKCIVDSAGRRNWKAINEKKKYRRAGERVRGRVKLKLHASFSLLKNWKLSDFTSSSLKRATNDRSLDFTTLHDDDEKKSCIFSICSHLIKVHNLPLMENIPNRYSPFSPWEIKYRQMMLTRLTVATWCSSPSAASQSWPMVCARKSATRSAAWKCVCWICEGETRRECDETTSRDQTQQQQSSARVREY